MKPMITLILSTLILPAFAAGTGDHEHEHAEQGQSDDHHMYPFGEAGQVDHADRTINIVMSDNKYDLPSLETKAGETIHFKIINEGQQIHEFTIATTDMHIAHQDEMLEHISSGHMSMTDKGHGAGHDHDNSLLLNPGESGELTWTFANTENLEFACNVPGHYQSGMKGIITFN